MRRMRTLLFGLLVACGAGSLFAASLPPACQTALRRALDADAAWRMTRTLPGALRPLVSTGLVSCARFRGIVWDMRAPLPLAITLTTNAMVFADEEGMRVKDLDSLPYYAEIRARTDAFADGDATAFDGLFDWRAWMALDGKGWALALKPALAPLRRLFTRIDLSGAAEITNVTWRTPQQGDIRLDFTELGRGTHRLWEKPAK